MAIEVAEDNQDEYVDLTLDDDARYIGLSFYDILHMLIHQTGTEDWAAACAKATEAAVAELKEGESPEDVTVSVPAPDIKVPLSMMTLALERFKETHDAQELKEAAKGAQPHFGGGVHQLLQALAASGAVVVGVGHPDGEEPETPEAPGKKLH